jgi:hypothetical protein
MIRNFLQLYAGGSCRNLIVKIPYTSTPSTTTSDTTSGAEENVLIIDHPPLVSYAELFTLPSTLMSKRIIACLDVRENDMGDLVVTKGDQYDVRETNNSSSSK